VGHPQYQWEAHRKEKFAWWVRRFGETLRLFDGVRIDHFLASTARGTFRRREKRQARQVGAVAGNELFDVVTRALPGAQIIAEDLGKLTPQASALRDRFDFPACGSCSLVFGAGGSYHLPHRFTKTLRRVYRHARQRHDGWLV